MKFDKKEVIDLKILIIGSGVIGKATGIGIINKTNYEVIFYDIKKEKLEELRLLGYNVIDNYDDLSMENLFCSMICVPIPFIKNTLDLSYIKAALTDVARYILKKINHYHLIVIRSTIPPSITKTQMIPLLEKISNKRVKKNFGVCLNPEFLRERSAIEDFQNPWRIVIGEEYKRSGDILEKIYKNFDCPVIRTDYDSASMIKYLSNAFLASKISFFNEMYLICKVLGLDEHFIAKVVAKDPRIGNYGIFGGRPFEGRCLPKDLDTFIEFVENYKIDAKILKSVRDVNNLLK